MCEEADPEAVWVTWLIMALHLQYSQSLEMIGKGSSNVHLTCIQQRIYSIFWSSSPISPFLYYSASKPEIYNSTFMNLTQKSKAEEAHSKKPNLLMYILNMVIFYICIFTFSVCANTYM